MQVTKVKYDGKKVTVEYDRLRKDGECDQLSLASPDQPVRTFIEALASLSSDVVKICEFKGGDVDVRGCSFTWVKDNMGVVITALKAVDCANSPLVINTPHMTEKSYSASGEGGGSLMPKGLPAKLRKVLIEAERYVEGTRAPKAQGKLAGL